MMETDLRELYQEVILDHSRHPRNFGECEICDRHAHGYNPLCGDKIDVHLALNDEGVIEDLSFDGQGCAISVASASIMSEIVKGRSVDEVKALFERFHAMVKGDELATGLSESNTVDEDAMERLQVLAGVKQFPMRIKCATLAWHATLAAIRGDVEASTE